MGVKYIGALFGLANATIGHCCNGCQGEMICMTRNEQRLCDDYLLANTVDIAGAQIKTRPMKCLSQARSYRDKGHRIYQTKNAVPADQTTSSDVKNKDTHGAPQVHNAFTSPLAKYNSILYHPT